MLLQLNPLTKALGVGVVYGKPSDAISYCLEKRKIGKTKPPPPPLPLPKKETKYPTLLNFLKLHLKAKSGSA